MTSLIRAMARWMCRVAGAEAAVVRVRAIRGAIDVPSDDVAAIHRGVAALISTMEQRNAIVPAQVISALFTVTPDITSMFPARAARAVGWGAVPLMCATELAIQGALPMCIRVLVHVELPADQAVEHVYLGGAAALRPDLSPPRR